VARTVYLIQQHLQRNTALTPFSAEEDLLIYSIMFAVMKAASFDATLDAAGVQATVDTVLRALRP
jgi:hypothetical protein